MAIFTSAEITEQLTAWKAALLAVSTGQEYTMGTRRLARAELPEIRKTLEWLNSEQRGLSGQASAFSNTGRPRR